MQPHCAKFRLAAIFGHARLIPAGGCEAYADLIGSMAIALDSNADFIMKQQAYIELMERRVKILEEHVTTEGNDA